MCAVLACIGAIGGCAGPSNYALQDSYTIKTTAVRAYISQNYPAMQAGTLKKSDYWTGFYNILQMSPVRTADLITARGASRMIDAAQQLEAGRISPEQYESTRRDVQLTADETFQSLQAQQAAQQQEIQQQNKAMLMQYYLQTRPVTTTCFGNSCTSR